VNISKNQYIHTVSSIGGEKKPSLVFLHGYWSSNVSFVKIIKELSLNYNVHCIDTPSQGLSSRDDFFYEEPDEIIDYFVQSIDKWR
jgi:pimeloyl-ACP methyl ester carboxylesterase